MGRAFGSQSMFAPLRKVLVRRPNQAFAVDDPAKWSYTGRPDLERAQKEHDAFTSILRVAGAEVFYHEADQPGRADAIFVYDPAIVTDRGAVILRMGKDLRRGEEEALAARLGELRVPILGTLRGEARAEGGDLLWVDHDTLAVGQGFRTNAEGYRQLRRILKPVGVDTIPVDLPYFRGSQACLHLMSLVSVVDDNLAVIYPPLFPVRLWRELKERGVDALQVPDEEFGTMAPNVLALAPRHVVLLRGNPLTAAHLADAGCRVETYVGDEISLKAEGGPTCLTRPILREP